MTIDKTWVGAAVGMVLPIVTSLLFYRFAYHGRLDFFPFLSQMMEIRGVAMLAAVCCLPNLAVFTVFAYTDRLKIARGLFLATLIYAFVIVVLKFLV